MLTAESILSAQDTANLRKVEVPEWGGFVYVKIMSGLERDKWEMQTTQLLKNPTGNINIRAGLCAATICDEKGKRLFDDPSAMKLGEKSSIALDRVFEIAQKINRLSANDMEELEKNSPAAIRGVSGSN